jgi:hypothetical protein
VIDAREPKGFFTDQTPRDFDGAFEFNPRATRPTLGTGPIEEWAAIAGNTRLWTDKRNINSINDDGGAGGFDLQQAAVNARRSTVRGPRNPTSSITLLRAVQHSE